MQIKTTMRYHLTPIRMAIIKKTRDNKFWQECGEKDTCVPLVETYIGIATVENNMEVFQKAKNRTTI